MNKRHVAGSSMSYIVLTYDLLNTPGYTPLEKMVYAYDQQNETPETSDQSCADFLGVPVESVTEARNHLLFIGAEVEMHRDSDLTEDEYYE